MSICEAGILHTGTTAEISGLKRNRKKNFPSMLVRIMEL